MLLQNFLGRLCMTRNGQDNFQGLQTENAGQTWVEENRSAGLCARAVNFGRNPQKGNCGPSVVIWICVV